MFRPCAKSLVLPCHSIFPDDEQHVLSYPVVGCGWYSCVKPLCVGGSKAHISQAAHLRFPCVLVSSSPRYWRKESKRLLSCC